MYLYLHRLTLVAVAAAALILANPAAAQNPFSEAIKAAKDVKQKAEARDPLAENGGAPKQAPAPKPAPKAEAAPATPPVASQPADPVDNVMGDYEGGEGMVANEAKVIAEGKGNYRVLTAVAAADGKPERVELKGKLEAGVEKVPLASDKSKWTGEIANGVLTLKPPTPDAAGSVLKRVVKKSPAAGAKPPAGAIVLLPYEPGTPTNLDQWTNKNWKRFPDGTVEVYKGNNKTVRSFGDCKLHVEFRCPYMPDARGQGRGNSGVYLQDRYEVQVLDSFGLPINDNECGGLYKVAKPKVNASFPPLSWQTYDITFLAPRLDDKGQMVKPALITVEHNGVLIHDKVELRNQTGGGAPGAARVAPILLQDHGNAVRYRNIWIVELKDEPAAETK